MSYERGTPVAPSQTGRLAALKWACRFFGTRSVNVGAEESLIARHWCDQIDREITPDVMWVGKSVPRPILLKGTETQLARTCIVWDGASPPFGEAVFGLTIDHFPKG